MLAVDVPGYNVELSKTDGLTVTQKPVPPTPLWLKILKIVAIVLFLLIGIVVLIIGARAYKKRQEAGGGTAVRSRR
jgi:hypothetical protein